jgi:hypothetical protein
MTVCALFDRGGRQSQTVTSSPAWRITRMISSGLGGSAG